MSVVVLSAALAGLVAAVVWVEEGVAAGRGLVAGHRITTGQAAGLGIVVGHGVAEAMGSLLAMGSPQATRSPKAMPRASTRCIAAGGGHRPCRLRSIFPDEPLTLEQVFSTYVDIMAVPPRHFFHILSLHTDDAQHKRKLAEFASKTLEAKDALYEYCKREKRSVAEVMWDFWTARPPLDLGGRVWRGLDRKRIGRHEAMSGGKSGGLTCLSPQCRACATSSPSAPLPGLLAIRRPAAAVCCCGGHTVCLTLRRAGPLQERECAPDSQQGGVGAGGEEGRRWAGGGWGRGPAGGRCMGIGAVGRLGDGAQGGDAGGAETRRHGPPPSPIPPQHPGAGRRGGQSYLAQAQWVGAAAPPIHSPIASPGRRRRGGQSTVLALVVGTVRSGAWTAFPSAPSRR